MKTFSEYLIEADFKTLKKNKINMEPEERAAAMKAGCVWHFQPSGKPSCAIWKSKDSSGKVVYGSNTHRAFKSSPTLKGAIKDFKFIKSTA